MSFLYVSVYLTGRAGRDRRGGGRLERDVRVADGEPRADGRVGGFLAPVASPVGAVRACGAHRAVRVVDLDGELAVAAPLPGEARQQVTFRLVLILERVGVRSREREDVRRVAARDRVGVAAEDVGEDEARAEREHRLADVAAREPGESRIAGRNRPVRRLSGPGDPANAALEPRVVRDEDDVVVGVAVLGVAGALDEAHARVHQLPPGRDRAEREAQQAVRRRGPRLAVPREAAVGVEEVEAAVVRGREPFLAHDEGVGLRRDRDRARERRGSGGERADAGRDERKTPQPPLRQAAEDGRTGPPVPDMRPPYSVAARISKVGRSGRTLAACS